MSKFNYSKTKTTAAGLIEKFGKTLTKVSITQGGSAFDPTSTEVKSSVVGVITELRNDEYDGTLVLRTDKKLLTTFDVSKSDKIEDGLIRYDVVDISVLQPSDVKIIYKVIIRG